MDTVRNTKSGSGWRAEGRPENRDRRQQRERKHIGSEILYLLEPRPFDEDMEPVLCLIVCIRLRSDSWGMLINRIVVTLLFSCRQHAALISCYVDFPISKSMCVEFKLSGGRWELIWFPVDTAEWCSNNAPRTRTKQATQNQINTTNQKERGRNKQGPACNVNGSTHRKGIWLDRGTW